MKTLLRSDDLNCPSCIPKIEKALGRLGGVTHARVHFATGRIEVEHDPERVKAERLASAVRDVGYEARVSAF
ncbi:heavy-metal-associated domain-containing protein [Halomonas piscis]|uniref:Heavy-metal-associated domain-containing protein n=1 Tax=Halomonas piscis TaxID=3031727 RepID=A0ABY9Z2Z2_9GAMM|nr:heavy-metal-associated domain-containing protein [Halomonas piscis]WNK20980.1 heavy-metal-associated domain-containing protein [Halomonas piscis]